MALPFSFQLPSELFFRWKHLEILGGKDLLAVVQNRILRHRLVPFRTQDKADGGVVTFAGVLVIENPHIAIHLTYILMGQVSHLQIDQDEALQDADVEHQVHEQVGVVEGDALLARNESKSLAQFEKEGLKLADEGRCQVGFQDPMLLRQGHEIQHVGILNRVQRTFQHLSPVGEVHHAGLVPAFQKPGKKAGVNLAFKLPDAPSLSLNFDFIKGAFLRILNPSQDTVMGPANGWGKPMTYKGFNRISEFITQCVMNSVRVLARQGLDRGGSIRKRLVK
jgi:hypothetical protein